MRSTGEEPLKACVFVVFIEREKILLEGAVEQQIQRLLMHRTVAELEDAKYVGDLGHRLQAHVDVVAEDKFIFDGNKILSNAVIGGRDPLSRNQLGRNRAKNVAPLFIKLIQPLAKLTRLRLQTIPDNLIRPAL